MAGEWLPMRMDLTDDPAVISMAAALNMDEFAVVGRLHRLWGWANRHLSSGNAPSVTEQWIDRFVSAPGFAAAMLAAGWLRSRSPGVEFPNFDRWNSQNAKRRLTETQRKQVQRAVPPGSGHLSRPKRDTDGTKPGQKADQRREEKREEPPTPSGGGVVAEDDPPEEVVDAAGTMIRPEPFSEVVAAWIAAKLPGWNSPGGIQANGARRGLFVARQRNPRWRGLWREAVARLGRSKRASGGSKGFEQGVRLDTFLKDEAFLDRIIEGEWDDEGVSPPPPPPIGRSKMLDQGMMDPMPLRTGSPHASAYRGGSHGF